MIRVFSLIGFSRHTCHNRVHRIFFIRSPYIFSTSHRHTVIIPRTALGTHNIIVFSSLCQMRRLNTSHVCSASPKWFWISNNLFFFWIILNNTDKSWFFIPFSCLPFQRDNIFLSVIIMQDWSIKSWWMQIYRLAPRSFDVFWFHQKIIYIKVSRIHGIHHTVYNIEHIFLFTISQTRRPYSFCTRQFFQVNRLIISQNMCI